MSVIGSRAQHVEPGQRVAFLGPGTPEHLFGAPVVVLDARSDELRTTVTVDSGETFTVYGSCPVDIHS